MLSRIFKNKERKQPTPTGAIADAFREYIANEIPTRFINTENFQFVSRSKVFDFFQDEIASVTEDTIKERIESSGSDLFASYQPCRDRVLRQVIQEIVKYDILSHRQGDIAQEPSFQDVEAGKKHASKFKKLVRKSGRKLAWVDTCCIDRRNAVELSEAINAMYKWYANAYLCIIHLGESTTYADWIYEPWFTRGWTLQELLAPRRLKFYSKTWQPFTPPGIDNDKESDDVIRYLELVTGMTKIVLTADNSIGVQGHTFWEKMTWVARRHMTSVEDIEYTLVGLFHALPICYGDGRRGFSSLVRAIATKDPSWDVFAWCGEPSMEHFALPPSPASYPVFEADLGKDRAGVKDISITRGRLSLKTLPLIPMEIPTNLDPEEPGHTRLIYLKPQSDKEGRYGDLLVECETTHRNIIFRSRQISACILNHHSARSREEGKLKVGDDYICFLLYSEDEGDDGTGEWSPRCQWFKLATNNLLRITCIGTPEVVTHGQDWARPSEFTLPLVTTSILSSD